MVRLFNKHAWEVFSHHTKEVMLNPESHGCITHTLVSHKCSSVPLTDPDSEESTRFYFRPIILLQATNFWSQLHWDSWCSKLLKTMEVRDHSAGGLFAMPDIIQGQKPAWIHKWMRVGSFKIYWPANMVHLMLVSTWHITSHLCAEATRVALFPYSLVYFIYIQKIKSDVH